MIGAELILEVNINPSSIMVFQGLIGSMLEGCLWYKPNVANDVIHFVLYFHPFFSNVLYQWFNGYSILVAGCTSSVYCYISCEYVIWLLWESYWMIGFQNINEYMITKLFLTLKLWLTDSDLFSNIFLIENKISFRYLNTRYSYHLI